MSKKPFVRAYVARSLGSSGRPAGVPAWPVRPGDTLNHIVAQFLESGVAPDFIPAELGTDGDGDFTEDGDLIIDPRGDIRTDLFEYRDRALVDGFADEVPAKRFGVESPAAGTEVPPAGENAVESPVNASSENAPE
ncbi:hypothetical protein [Dipodfec virus UOA04_Rod_720]|nr:hypothetical protein [Dipodfec virus UOA04_Rod_720]